MIKRLIVGDKEYILIGTAHVSEASSNEVRETIALEKPDAVAVELCQGRFDNINNENRFADLDIAGVLKKGQGLFVLGNILLSSYQKRIGDKLGVKPGAEMVAGIEAAKASGASLVLADRPIDITLKRVVRQLRWRDKISAISSIVEFLFSKDEGEEIDVDTIESLKEDSVIMDSISHMGLKFPNVKKYLLDERDSYLAYKIINSPGPKVVAVLGAAHLNGVRDHIVKGDITAQTIAEISVVPKKKKYGSILAAILLVVFLLLVVITFNNDPAQGASSIFLWLGLTSSLAGLGTLIAGGHPVTILATLVLAPIGAASPFLSAGVFGALVEAKMRKPKFKDINSVSNDILKLSKWRSNNLLRIFAVFIMASIGTMIGNLIGLQNILSGFFDSFK